VKRAALFIKMNDMPVQANIVIPLISRPRVRGAATKLVTQLSGWDLDLAGLHNWYRET
jgi:peptide/nickel transport system substrate-binding protein